MHKTHKENPKVWQTCRISISMILLPILLDPSEMIKSHLVSFRNWICHTDQRAKHIACSYSHVGTDSNLESELLLNASQGKKTTEYMETPFRLNKHSRPWAKHSNIKDAQNTQKRNPKVWQTWRVSVPYLFYWIHQKWPKVTKIVSFRNWNCFYRSKRKTHSMLLLSCWNRFKPGIWVTPGMPVRGRRQKNTMSKNGLSEFPKWKKSNPKCLWESFPNEKL